jgi:hypothetical protein
MKNYIHKHTPTPWELVPCSNPHEAFAIEANGKTICWVANTYDEKRDREIVTAEDRANARLLKKAPDLLFAAKCALADLEGIMPEFEPSGDREHPAWETIKLLRKAIR